MLNKSFLLSSLGGQKEITSMTIEFWQTSSSFSGSRYSVRGCPSLSGTTVGAGWTYDNQTAGGSFYRGTGSIEKISYTEGAVVLDEHIGGSYYRSKLYKVQPVFITANEYQIHDFTSHNKFLGVALVQGTVATYSTPPSDITTGQDVLVENAIIISGREICLVTDDGVYLTKRPVIKPKKLYVDNVEIAVEPRLVSGYNKLGGVENIYCLIAPANTIQANKKQRIKLVVECESPGSINVPCENPEFSQRIWIYPKNTSGYQPYELDDTPLNFERLSAQNSQASYVAWIKEGSLSDDIFVRMYLDNRTGYVQGMFFGNDMVYNPAPSEIEGGWTANGESDYIPDMALNYKYGVFPKDGSNQWWYPNIPGIQFAFTGARAKEFGT